MNGSVQAWRLTVAGGSGPLLLCCLVFCTAPAHALPLAPTVHPFAAAQNKAPPAPAMAGRPAPNAMHMNNGARFPLGPPKTPVPKQLSFPKQTQAGRVAANTRVVAAKAPAPTTKSAAQGNRSDGDAAP